MQPKGTTERNAKYRNAEAGKSELLLRNIVGKGARLVHHFEGRRSSVTLHKEGHNYIVRWINEGHEASSTTFYGNNDDAERDTFVWRQARERFLEWRDNKGDKAHPQYKA